MIYHFFPGLCPHIPLSSNGISFNETASKSGSPERPDILITLICENALKSASCILLNSLISPLGGYQMLTYWLKFWVRGWHAVSPMVPVLCPRFPHFLDVSLSMQVREQTEWPWALWGEVIENGKCGVCLVREGPFCRQLFCHKQMQYLQ